MTPEDQVRLAQIRAQVEKWKSLRLDAATWDSAFLISIVDKLTEELRRSAEKDDL